MYALIITSMTAKPSPNPAKSLACPPDEERWWQAVAERDAALGGEFYYGVKTTGIFCLPSCASRPPLRKNVKFFTTCEQAERAGYRACKRCQPTTGGLEEQHAAMVAKACRIIESEETVPKLGQLSRRIGMSSYHFHRTFKRLTGLTPKAYATAHRAEKIRRELSRGNSVTEAIYEAGYNSNARFYEKSSEILGMQPKTYLKGGEGVTIRFAVCECSLGSILVASSDEGICAISLGNDPDLLVRELQDLFPKATLKGGDAKYERLVARVVAYVENPHIGLDLPLHVRGTAFQQLVWKALRGIPPGETVSYAEIAEKIGMPKAVRAVAQACGANKLAVAIPCHRVVRTDGNLSGYRWGVERKRALLNKEAVA